MGNNYYKKFSLLCEECNCLSDQSVSMFYDGAELAPDFYEEFTNYYYCKNCGKFTFQFDIERNIAMSVRLLRIHGYNTRFSCEGHSKAIFRENKYLHNTSYPYICFDANKELPERFEEILNMHDWEIKKFNSDQWRISDNSVEFCDEEFDKDPQNYVDCLNKAFKLQDEKLFKALLEIFINE